MTILEAFQQAKEEGHYWADKALANLEKEYENDQVKYWWQALTGGFGWNSSEEGWTYWNNIYQYFKQQ